MPNDQNQSDNESLTIPKHEDTGDASMLKCDDSSLINSTLQEQPSPTMANSKLLELVKNNVIAANKLMKLLEVAASESVSSSQQVSHLTEALALGATENTNLKNELLSTKATILELIQKASQVVGLGERTSTLDSIQNNATLAWKQNTLAKDLLSSREMYIKQMEAQLENLEAKLSAPDYQPQKRRRRNSTLQEQKEKQLKELQQQLATIRENQKSSQEHKADMETSYKVLQQDHQKLKQKLEAQQELHRTEQINMEQQQRQTRMNTNTNAVSLDELDGLYQKLQQNNAHVEYLENEVKRWKNKDDQTSFIEEFKQCLDENETRKKEKRVLQDKLTELWVTNQEYENARRHSLLLRYGLTTLPSLEQHDDYDTGKKLPTTTEEQTSTHHQACPPLLDKTTSDQPSPYDQHANRHTLSLSTHKHKSKDLEDNNTQRTTFLHNSAPKSKTQQLMKQQEPTKNDLMLDSASVSSSDSSSSTPSPSSYPNSSSSSSSSSTDTETDSKYLPSLSDMAFGKRKKVPVKSTPIQDDPEHIRRQPSNLSLKLPLTEAAMESTTLQAAEIATRSPEDIDKSFLHRKSFDGPQMDVLLSSLDPFYQKLQTMGIPIVKLKKSGIQETMGVCSYGVEDQINLNGCPNYFDVQEKKLAWTLWALISLYSKNGHYSKVVKWATFSALKGMSEGRGNLACRYIRLMVLLCKNANDKQWVLQFCCDLVRQSPKDSNIMSPLLNIALTWPGLLNLAKAEETNLVIRTIQQCCAHYCKSSRSTKNVGCAYAYMVSLANWPELQQTASLLNHINTLKRSLTSPNFRGLYDTNRNAFDDLRSLLVKSLDISYWRLNDWKATYHGFILADLWPLMNDPVLSFTSIELIGLLIRCGLPPPDSKKPAKPGVALIQKTFMDLLENGNDCTTVEQFPSQCLLANYLVWMAPRNTEIGDVVIRWYDGLEPSLVNMVSSDLAFGIEGLRSRTGRIDYFSDQNDEDGITIYVEELMDSAYGYYVWPSSLVLSQYVWHHRNSFKNKTVLEVGAGTSLPSLVLTKVDSPPHLIVTDIPSIIPVARSCLKLNGTTTTEKNGMFVSSTSSLWVRGLEWGDLGSVNSVDRLLNDMGAQWHDRHLDYILGSDTFYNPPDFEKLLMTVAYVIHRHNNKCKFVTAYQERSSKRSIQFLLDKWSLQCRLISRDSFGFDEWQFVGGGNDGDNSDTDSNDGNDTIIPHVKVNAGTLASVFVLEISAKNPTG